MDWIIEPVLGFKEMLGINVSDGCCSDKAYAGPCNRHLTCSGSAKLIIRQD